MIFKKYKIYNFFLFTEKNYKRDYGNKRKTVTSNYEILNGRPFEYKLKIEKVYYYKNLFIQEIKN